MSSEEYLTPILNQSLVHLCHTLLVQLYLKHNTYFWKSSKYFFFLYSCLHYLLNWSSVFEGHFLECLWPTVDLGLCVSSGSPWLCDTHVWQMRRPVTQPRPGRPSKAWPEGEEVRQMACEVYIHCPLLNRLALMKCLMPGLLADIILPGSPAPWLPKKSPSLQPSVQPSRSLCCHPGRLCTRRCPPLIMPDSVRSDMQM